MYKTEKKIEALAEAVVDGMDVGDLIIYANEQLIEYYKTISSKEFTQEWGEIFD